MIEWNKMNKFCKWHFEDTHGKQRCEKRQSHPCDYEKCPLRKETPKTVKKTFVIEYENDLTITAKFIRDNLNKNVIGAPFVKVEEVPTLPFKYCNNCGTVMEYWYANSNKPYCPACYNGTATVKDKKAQKRWKEYLAKYSEIPEKDGKDDDMQAIGDYPDMYDLAAKMLKKSEEPEIVKSCENCNWQYGEKLCKNPDPCLVPYSAWKPIEEEKTTKFPEHGKNYTFSDKTEKK